MDKTYIDRVRRALEPQEHPAEEGRRREKRHDLRITKRMYSVPWDQTFLTNGPVLYSRAFLEGSSGGMWREPVDSGDSHSVFVYYEGRCRVGSEITARFTVSGDTLLSGFAAKITSSSQVPERVFFVIKETIYLRSVDESSVKFATMLFQLKAFEIKEWGVPLEQCIGDISEEIYFYDGAFSKYVCIDKIIFSHRWMGPYVAVKHLLGRAQLCKCCLKNNATMRVSHDPILPSGKKYICKRCFDLLFLDSDGRSRYEGMRVESLY